ncbi:MAG: BamA/TamA family outer membrane protein [Anaerohalosphaeraceae bacterium]|nr:BamA/TamA family outer membrane protein [Anaerohalosphaeraceae bacterium]
MLYKQPGRIWLTISAIGVLSLLFFAGFGRAAEPVDAAAFEGITIGSIETAGNVYVRRGKILAMTRSKVGQTFSVAEVQEDVRRIATLKGIEYVYYNLAHSDGKVILTFVVKEKNVIRQITFAGNDKYSQKKLAEEIGFSRGDYLDKFTAAAGAEKLTEHYNKKGYPFVQVSFDDSQIERGQLHYSISEGTRVKIKKTYFKGNINISRRELLKAVKSKPKTFLVIQNYFSQKKLDDDVVKIQKAYDRLGYLDTKVLSQVSYSSNNKKSEITFEITEGREYMVEEILFSGNEFLSDANLMTDFRLEKEQFYSDEKAEYDRDNVLSAYRQIGFIEVTVENKRRFIGQDRINAEFNIEEGQRFRIGKVSISGNKTVQDKVVRRVLDEEEFKPGEWYNADIARGDGQGELEKFVKSSVYTESVTITPVGEEPGQKDAEVRIKEGKTGSIIFGAGISSTDGAIGQVVYEQRNFDSKKWPKSWRKFFSDDAFKGAGQRFRIALEPGTKISRYSISFTEPYLNDKPISKSISGSSWQRGRESYDEERLSGRLGYVKRLKQGKYRGLAFRLENVGIESIDNDAPKEVRDIKGDNLLAGVKLSFGRDATDSRTNPSKGYGYEMSYEQVGGDHTFGVLSASYRKYKVLKEDIARRKTILEMKFMAGTIVGDAPLFEKFYAGGSGSVRGFAYRGISKRSGPDNDPVGSDWIATASGEVILPLGSDNLAGLFFADTGIIDTGGVRASVGIGVQIMIPQWFGEVPMRFEIATPIMKNGEDDTEFFSFSVGRLF